jgi:hypothetical protein
MSRPQYDVKEIYIGTGSLDEYTFDFKITDLLQLSIIEVNDLGVETQRVRGDDITYLSGVVFDAVAGGGTVTLAANLPTNYQLILVLANDAPTQPYEFRNKTSFTLRRFEDALDNILGAVQRLVYRVNQSIRIHDLDDETTINLQLPPGFADNASRVLVVNAAGTGVEYGPTSDEIANAQAAAQAALDAQQAAQDAQQAALDAQTAAAASEAAAAAAAQAAIDAAAAAGGIPSTFVDFNGPLFGTLNKNEVGTLRSGASFALTLSNIGLLAGDTIEIKFLGFTGVLTVTPAGHNIEGVPSKALGPSVNASFRFRYTGTEWIIT